MHDPDQYARLSDILVRRMQATPQNPAVQDRRTALDYQELVGKAAALAREMVAGQVHIGDRVFLLIGNSASFAVAFWAIQMAGAVAVPLPVDTPADRLEWMIGDSEPALILAEPGVTVSVAPLWTVEIEQLGDATPPSTYVAPEDLALMIYTSGSTGTPKGVMLSQRAVVTAACSVASYLGYRADDRIFCAIPFTFDYGMHQLTMAALSGASVYAERDFSRPFVSLHTLARSGATVLPLVPTLGALLVQIGKRFDLGGLRIVTNTAAALGTTLIDDLRAMMPGARLFSMYGLTECHRCTYLEPDQLDIRKTSVGKAIPYTRMWVVDDEGNRHEANATGELVIAGDTIMQGYWGRPDATAARLKIRPETGETTFHTGDICRLDEEGYCYFIGRADDILKVRGQKVAPVEVERCLVTHPGIAQAAVLGQDDPLLGTAVVAVVEPAPGATLDPAEVIAYASARLPLPARPVRVQIERGLPRNANGKIDKRAIRLAEPVA
ncbi:MAG: class I adenylate-forming enzyme family protein [Defluviimonas denitrificans]